MVTEPKFNLIDEPWIRVVGKDGKEKEVGLLELFTNASEMIVLAGETLLQDTAILRLLVALNVTMLYQYKDAGGGKLELKKPADAREAIERFKKVWDEGKFSEPMIKAYFEKWRDKFFLLGGDWPFYQVPSSCWKLITDGKKGTTDAFIRPYGASEKMTHKGTQAINGEVLESSNSPALFSGRYGSGKFTLSYAEAARWLPYTMAYSDCSSKIPGSWCAARAFASCGANIHPNGRNLFETIMLCSCMVDPDGNIYSDISPAWERNECTEIAAMPYGGGFPNNLPELYTQQSRKMVYIDNGECIVDAYMAAGDKYGCAEAYIEPMFSFREGKDVDTGKIVNRPISVSEGVSGWKEFDKLFGDDTQNATRWIKLLFDNKILDENINIPFCVTDIGYGTMYSVVNYVTGSFITVGGKFFEKSEEMAAAKEEIANIQSFTNILVSLGRNIDIAIGEREDKERKLRKYLPEKLKTQYEYLIGQRFAGFLTGKMSQRDLRDLEARLAYEVANRVLDDVSLGAIVGHGDHTIGTAENIFSGSMYKKRKELGLIEDAGGDGNDE